MNVEIVKRGTDYLLRRKDKYRNYLYKDMNEASSYWWPEDARFFPDCFGTYEKVKLQYDIYSEPEVVIDPLTHKPKPKPKKKWWKWYA